MALGRVAQLRNGSGDRSYSVTAQLEKHFSGGTEVSAAYTYTDARDRMGMVADRGSDIIRSTPVDGTLEERNVRTSIWERPHKITFVGTTDLPFGFRLGVTYIGMSGQPYTYVSQGDPNADGLLPRDRRVERCRLRAEGRRRHHAGGPDQVRRARRVHSEGTLPSKPAWPAPSARQLPRSLAERNHGATVEAISPRGQADASRSRPISSTC